jgi:TRAP-type mannitol/chloroaromatic compound transport system permease small subunit
MLISKLLELILNIFMALFFFLPSVSKLPSIAGYDIDTALVTGVGQAYNFAGVVWPIWDVLLGALFLWTFHGLMLFVKLLLGHRAPVS